MGFDHQFTNETLLRDKLYLIIFMFQKLLSYLLVELIISIIMLK